MKSATIGQHVRVTWSDDEGQTWSESIDPFGALSIDGKPGAVRMAATTPLGGDRVVAILGWVDQSNPSLPFYNEQTEGLLDMKILLSFSDDSGATWSRPRVTPMPGYSSPTPITGPVLVMPNGQWACSFEVNKHYNDPTPWIHESVMAVSNDRGQTWDHCHVITRDTSRRYFYWDQRLSLLPDGRLFDVFWSFNREEAVYMNIHASESVDGGKTWSSLWDTDVPGQPAPVVPLPDGSLAMVYVDRTAEPVIKVRRSSDGGRTWPESTENWVHDNAVSRRTRDKSSMNDAWSEMADFSLGLPTTALLPDGRVLIVYYNGARTDHTAIRWALLELDR